MGMFEYIAQRPMIGVIMGALIILTFFVCFKAYMSGKKRNAEKEKIIAQLEKEKALRSEFRSINDKTFAADRDNYRLVIGMCANVQMKIEKAENINAEFAALSDVKRNTYCLGYVFEDSQSKLSEFFRSNGEPLLSAAKNAVHEVIGGDFAKFFDKEFSMLDDNNEDVSVDDEILKDYDAEFTAFMAENKEKVYKKTADYIRANKDEFLK